MCKQCTHSYLDLFPIFYQYSIMNTLLYHTVWSPRAKRCAGSIIRRRHTARARDGGKRAWAPEGVARPRRPRLQSAPRHSFDATPARMRSSDALDIAV